ncbi:MAG: hypothetical protein KDI46_01255 [Alphaproteobacteria bacterium]|nr:hypothetical protein [Alphaproteobacteria bacterium]
MNIDQAYQAIPHNQTPYSLKQSRLPDADAKYLDHYFFVSDIALRARVMALNRFLGKTPAIDIQTYNQEVENAIASFALIQTPRHLQQIENTLISALRDQQSFFNEWNDMAGTHGYSRLQKTYTRHPKVMSSHQKLIKAYQMLKQTYPSETPYNQNAFFDHLCALDFI